MDPNCCDGSIGCRLIWQSICLDMTFGLSWRIDLWFQYANRHVITTILGNWRICTSQHGMHTILMGWHGIWIVQLIKKHWLARLYDLSRPVNLLVWLVHINCLEWGTKICRIFNTIVEVKYISIYHRRSPITFEAWEMFQPLFGLQ